MTVLVTELEAEHYEALDTHGPLLVPVPTLEARQGVLVQKRRIYWIDRLGTNVAHERGFTEGVPVLRVWSRPEEGTHDRPQ